jgi:hypothetical protein
MGRRLVLLLVAALALSTSGCVMIPRPLPQRAAAVKSPRCEPSQEWDGEICRHKGKGRGARKHDD